jgi:hypothetical protein
MTTRSFAPVFILSFVLITMAGASAFGQALAMITFRPMYHGTPIRFDDAQYQGANGSRVTFSMLKFYISDLRVRTTDGASVKIGGHHLLDLTDDETSSISIIMPNTPIASFDFTVGIDSVLNEQGPQEGALDPRNGMYWTWSTGYVFFKLEGTVESASQPKRVYEIHVGGYKAPYRNMIDVRCTVPATFSATSSSCTIDVELAKLLDGDAAFDLVMRPSVTTAQQAVDVATRIGEMFRVR